MRGPKPFWRKRFSEADTTDVGANLPVGTVKVGDMHLN